MIGPSYIHSGHGRYTVAGLGNRLREMQLPSKLAPRTICAVRCGEIGRTVCRSKFHPHFALQYPEKSQINPQSPCRRCPLSTRSGSEPSPSPDVSFPPPPRFLPFDASYRPDMDPGFPTSSTPTDQRLLLRQLWCISASDLRHIHLARLKFPAACRVHLARPPRFCPAERPTHDPVLLIHARSSPPRPRSRKRRVRPRGTQAAWRREDVW